MRGWTAEPFFDPSVDEAFMKEALALGRANLGRTWPNPSVGAVVVKDGVVVGRGATQAGGRPHAEAVALAEAGLNAVGAVLYVTLEPCSHRSVRGGIPCLEHALLSGVRRVVSALEDPNPHISGISHALLRSAGIKVTLGVAAAEARRDNLGHILRIQQKRPMVTLKLAQTADGYCALPGGGRLQISGDIAMREVHQFRATHDAIMIGVGTAISDDPQLNVRLPGLEDRSPLRIVLDSHLRLPVSGKLVASARELPLWIISGEDAPSAAEEKLRERGADIFRVKRDPDGNIDLGAVMNLLASRGITRVFSEGGPTVAAALVKQDLVDTMVVSTADHALGQEGVVALRPEIAIFLSDASRFSLVDTTRFGTDVFQRYERQG
jgi:diaminohydroxyphosphoribosylaminopyrimidine deaminase / 5-amino-6-(5-phosphoribosylamino)uracil reductase